MAYLRKFGPDDKLINRMETRPQYEVLLYPGKQGVADPTVLINNRRFQGVNIPSGTISLFEMNVDRAGTAEHPGSLIYRFLVSGSGLDWQCLILLYSTLSFLGYLGHLL